MPLPMGPELHLDLSLFSVCWLPNLDAVAFAAKCYFRCFRWKIPTLRFLFLAVWYCQQQHRRRVVDHVGWGGLDSLKICRRARICFGSVKCSDVSPWRWTWPWMLGMTLYLTQAASDKNSLLHWCDGVCWLWQYIYRHMVMALFTYHLSSVSNLHLILGNLLLLVSLAWCGSVALGTKSLALALSIKSLLTSLLKCHIVSFKTVVG